MFECDKCNYSTDKKSNFDRHKNTHKNDMKQFTCKYCECKYAIQKNYINHLNVCTQKDMNSMKKQLKQEQKEKEYIIKQIEYVEKQREEDKKFFIRIIDSAGITFKEALPPLKFADNNLYYAPQMLEYSNFTFLEIYDTPDLAVEAIINHYNKGTLHSFLGDEIVNEYVKKDPRDQSVWNSDTNRSTYLNRVLIITSGDGECVWTIDKKGIKTIQFLIDPLIKHVKDMIDIYYNKMGDILKLKNPDFAKYGSHCTAITGIYEIINDGTLKANILKYINGFFYLDQTFAKKTIESLPITEEIQAKFQDKAIRAIETKKTNKLNKKDIDDYSNDSNDSDDSSNNKLSDNEKIEIKSKKPMKLPKVIFKNKFKNKSKNNINDSDNLLSDEKPMEIKSKVTSKNKPKNNNIESNDLLSDEEPIKIKTKFKVIPKNINVVPNEPIKIKTNKIQKSKNTKSKHSIDESDDLLSDIEPIEIKSKNTKNIKSKKNIVESDDLLSDEEPIEIKTKQTKSKNIKPKNNIVESDDLLSDEEPIEIKTKPKNVKLQSKPKYNILESNKKVIPKNKLKSKSNIKTIKSKNKSNCDIVESDDRLTDEEIEEESKDKNNKYSDDSNSTERNTNTKNKKKFIVNSNDEFSDSEVKTKRKPKTTKSTKKHTKK